MPDKAPPSVSPESFGLGHEVTDRSPRNPLIIAGSAAAMIVFTLILCAILFGHFARQRPMQSMRPLGLILAPNLDPLQRFPKPNLQIDDDRAEMLSLRSAQDQELNQYGWVNRTNGIIHIPIERAIDLVAARGLPYRTNNAVPVDGTTLQLMQQRPEER
ncbi:MAG TPA: hypothetical protein VFV81_09780 [Verrucomicrobiae bacterium]|nr:hypothetical protein [Verrucomicrobiae bacterium]